MKKIMIFCLFAIMANLTFSEASSDSLQTIEVWNDPGKYLQVSKLELEAARKKDDKALEAKALNSIGLGFDYLSSYDKALEYFMESLKIYEELGDQKGIANSLNSIGMIYKKVKNHLKALEYYQKSLTIYRELDDKQGIATSLTYIGNIYYHLVEFDTALEYFAESLEIYEAIEDEKGITFPLNNTGTIYEKIGEYDKALKYFEKSLEVSLASDEKWGIANTSNNIGGLHVELKNFDKALFHLENAEKIAKEIRAKDLLLDAYDRLSKLYLYKNNKLKYLEYHKLYADIKDSIFSDESNKNIAELQTAFAVEKKEMENRILRLEIEKQRVFNYAFISILTIISIFTYSIITEKKKSEKLLLNVLPARVAKDLKKNGKTVPESFDNVTVFFSDIVGFTKLTSGLEPSFLIDELNDIFTAFDDIMAKYKCERIETKGDAYLAVCGMPEKNETHAERIIQASIEIMEFMEKRRKDAKIPWQIRIGIHTGKVVGGVIGIRKYSYNVFGDTINTAARMEQNSHPMKINISESTYRIVKDGFSFTAREAIEVKGKGKMMMYFVEDVL